jgi:hypothetical protein
MEENDGELKDGGVAVVHDGGDVEEEVHDDGDAEQNEEDEENLHDSSDV